MSNAWLTPDNAPDGTRQVALTIPDGEEWEAIVRGALSLLLFSTNFEEFGSYGPDDAVAVFAEALDATFEDWNTSL